MGEIHPAISSLKKISAVCFSFVEPCLWQLKRPAFLKHDFQDLRAGQICFLGVPPPRLQSHNGKAIAVIDTTDASTSMEARWVKSNLLVGKSKKIGLKLHLVALGLRLHEATPILHGLWISNDVYGKTEFIEKVAELFGDFAKMTKP